MNILNLQTGEPFDPAPRLHHKDALEGPSSAGFAKRNLVGMMGVMMGGGASFSKIPYMVFNVAKVLLPKVESGDCISFYFKTDSSTYGSIVYICGVEGSNTSTFAYKVANGRFNGSSLATINDQNKHLLDFKDGDGSYCDGIRASGCIYSNYDKQFTIGTYREQQAASMKGTVYTVKCVSSSGSLKWEYVPKIVGGSPAFVDSVSGDIAYVSGTATYGEEEKSEI